MLKYRLSLFAFLLFSSHAIGQKGCTEGQMEIMTNNISSSQDICFVKETKALNYFFTKYIIQRESREIYEVNFSYFRDVGPDKDSIAIAFFDKQGITNCGLKHVTLSRINDIFSIVKDFQLNESLINEKEFNSIIFSIPNEDEPYIELNQFQAIDGQKIFFRLQPVQPELKKKYTEDVSGYWDRKRYMQNEINKGKENVLALKKRMQAYAAQKIEAINLETQKIMKGQSPVKPPAGFERIQQAFSSRLDSIFIPYFSRFFRYTDESFEPSFTFECDGYGKIVSDLDRELTYKNGTPIGGWFKDSVRENIKPQIEDSVFAVIPSIYEKEGMVEEFIAYFKDSINIIFTQHPLLNIDSLKEDFETTKNSISNSLAPFSKKNISIPTLFTYGLKYSTSTKIEKWKYKGGNEINRKSEDALPEILKENWNNLIQTFISKIHPETNKIYQIKICTLFINDKYKGLDLQIVN